MGRALALVLVLLLGIATVVVIKLRASRAQLDGRVALAGLSAPVVVERDAAGVPTVHATNRVDAARAVGFLHAQERFFQMDLMRRLGAGELAELVGPGAVRLDRQRRFHGLREVAREATRRLSPRESAIVQAYAAGVNDGLASLGTVPPEYLLLRTTPRRWEPEDSFLVAASMFFTLQDADARHERAYATLAHVLPPAALDFFVPLGTEWDSPIDGSVIPTAPIPAPEVFSLGGPGPTNAPASAGNGVRPDGPVPGSNSWAVDGRHTPHGAALVANDMHLGLGLPPVWYRVRLICPATGPDSPALDLTGASLPGSPLVVVGSNGSIAWSFTNAELDTSDIVPLELAKDAPDRYRTPDGWQSFTTRNETIAVKGGKPETLAVRMSIWGPVRQPDKSGPAHAVRWIAHLPESVNLRLLELEHTTTTAAALQLAPECGIPIMNFVVGDRAGNIGWTLCGRLPRRVGFDGRLPATWAAGAKRWDGFVPANAYPRVVNPPDGRLWTANNRIAGSEEYLALGPWTTALGARAKQIGDGLAELSRAEPADLLRIQLDDRALFLDRWQQLLLRTLTTGSNAIPQAGGIVDSVRNWGARAMPESSGYTLVQAFRGRVLELVLEPLSQRARKLQPDFAFGFHQVERPVWTILTQRPAHLLNPRFSSFEALVTTAAQESIKTCRQSASDPTPRRWGEFNRVTIQHPLSQALGPLARWLDLPPMELPGDDDMPRVQGHEFGASERMAVAPGHEAEGYFELPGGQSGHLLSPFYRAGHENWAQGKRSPFLPGPAIHELTLTTKPAGN